MIWGGEEVAEPVADGRGGVADGVEGALQAGTRAPLLAGVAATGGQQARPVGGLGEVEEVLALGRIQLQGARDGLEHAGGDAGEIAPLELGVVLDADAGQPGDLAAPQAGDASAPVLG